MKPRSSIFYNKTMGKTAFISCQDLSWKFQDCCYGTDFVVTASAFYLFYFGVELQHSAVAGSQLSLFCRRRKPTLSLLCRRRQPTVSLLYRRRQPTLSTLPSPAVNSLSTLPSLVANSLYSAVACSQLSLLCRRRQPTL